MRFGKFNFRKLTYLLSFALLLLMQQVQGQRAIVSANIEYEFISKKVSGTIGGFKSVSTYFPERLSESIFQGSVSVETIKTGNFLRDWSLKGGKYFDEDDYPLISFKSTAVMAAADKIKVVGELTLKGVSKSITIYFVEDGNTLSGDLIINSTDYGINIKKKREENEVRVKFNFKLE